MIVGIDLGTTNSLVSIWDGREARLIPNALGSVLTPSAVSIGEEGEVIVGAAARDRLSTHLDRTVASFKRYMGTNREFDLGNGRRFRPEELSALVLRSLKADAEMALGSTITEAIITVPAYFNDTQRKATRLAGELAGLKVERLLNEPTAAALAYGLQVGADESKILVLDLGGGTFDVSILEMFSGIMEVRASAGDNHLGGEDFVDLIMDAFLAEKGQEAGIPSRNQPHPIHGALRRQAELAKRALGGKDWVDIELVHGDQALRWGLDRDRFEAISEPLLARIRLPIERAIRDAAVQPDDITHLILVGGATRMPMVRKLAARLFQRLPVAQVDPDEVVARGAAVQAGLKARDAALEDVVMTDVAPFTLGVETSRQQFDTLMAGVYSPIIERNTVIPASRSRSYQTTYDNQTMVRFHIYQGESRLAHDNILLGEMKIAVPPSPAGQEKIEVRFTYDVSGLLEVEARNRESVPVRLVIEGTPGSMSPQEIETRLRNLAALKIHPRDLTENQALMARAVRLYEERLGELREAIGRAIDKFRFILERQDPEVIKTYRTEFLAWLDQIDVGYF